MRSRLFRLVLPSLPAIATVGCFTLTPPEPPDPPLDRDAAVALAKCQKTIAKESIEFSNLKARKLFVCTKKVVKSRLLFENAVIDEDAHEADLAKARETCSTKYEQISVASTEFVDRVIDACEPVADAILGEYDALRFQILEGFAEDESDREVTVDSIEDLAGLLCSVNELFVDLATMTLMPRTLELLGYLGEEFLDDSGGIILPAIDLDPRCQDIIDPS